jgi:recombination protein RecA
MFQKGQLLDEALEPTKRSSETAFGNEVLVKIEKTKICKPDRLVGKYTLAYYSGIEWVYDLLEILINKGVVLQAGSWIQFTNPETGEPMEQYRSQGKTKSVATLKSNPQLLDTYIRYVEKYVINSEDK